MSDTQLDTLRDVFDRIEEGDELHIHSQDTTGFAGEEEYEVVPFDEEEWTIPQGSDDDPERAIGLCQTDRENRLTSDENRNRAEILAFDNGQLQVKCCPHVVDYFDADFSPDWVSDTVTGLYNATQGVWAGRKAPEAVDESYDPRQFSPGDSEFAGGPQ